MDEESILLDARLILIVVLSLLILGYLRRIRNSYKFFENLGLKNPPVRFFLGNFHQTYRRVPERLRQWTKQYGKIYGYFEGHFPILVTTDMDIITEVFLKQFNNFAARRLKPLDAPDNSKRVNLVNAIETRWKNMRSIISPAFSPLKLKEMNPILESTTNRFIQVLSKNSEKTFNVSKTCQKFSMDTLWNCAFGVDINCQLDEKECVIIQKVDEALDKLSVFGLASYLSTFLHEFHSPIITLYIVYQLLLFKLRRYPFFKKFLSPLFWLRENSINIVNKRFSDDATHKRDFLGLLIDAYTDNLNELQQLDKINAEKTVFKKKLSIEEINMNLSAFIMAGYDTTYLTLSYCFHYLALYASEQEKMYAEVQGLDAEPNVENIKELEYTRMFIDEVQRMNPILSSGINRRCMHETVIKGGIKIPKGLVIQVDVESVHFDAELWGPVDPELFHPERFSKEHKRPALAFLSFGGGPRHCIGMRFAYNVITLLLAKVLLKYEIHRGDNFKIPLRYRDGFVRNILDPVNIKLVERK